MGVERHHRDEVGVGNPVVNMNEPITIRFLCLPDGASLPAAPSAPP